MSCPGLQGRDQAPSECYDSRGEGGEGPEDAAHTWAGAVSSAAAIGLCGRSGTGEEVLIPGRAGAPRAPPNLSLASVQRGRLLLRLLSVTDDADSSLSCFLPRKESGQMPKRPPRRGRRKSRRDRACAYGNATFRRPHWLKVAVAQRRPFWVML